MKRTKTASLLKTLLGGALALAISTAPVTANSNNSNGNDQSSAAFIATLLGLATIGVLLSNNDDDGKRIDPGHTRSRGRHVHPTPKTYPPRKRRVPTEFKLPGKCYQTYRTQQGKRNFYNNRCLKRNFSYVSNLPRACKERVVVRNKSGTYVTRKIYHAKCLFNRGYRAKAFY